MQFCHISGYFSFFSVHSYEWTFLARRYGYRCPPYLVSTLTPKQTANCGLLILLRRRRRQKEVHMTEMKRKPILIPIDHGYGNVKTSNFMLALHGKLGNETERNLTRVKKKWLSLYP